MKLLKFIIPAFLVLGAAPVHAQQGDDSGDANATVSEGPRRFWQATMPGGHYMVALDRISTISMHDYLLEGLVVTEVTIDTTGRALTRFYHIAPLSDAAGREEITRVVDRGRELIDRAGQKAGVNAQNMVQKVYPTTTHAGTVEYRVLELADLGVLYDSLRKSWESGRGRKVTIE